jgi:hypothetical protein
MSTGTNREGTTEMGASKYAIYFFIPTLECYLSLFRELNKPKFSIWKKCSYSQYRADPGKCRKCIRAQTGERTAQTVTDTNTLHLAL